MLIIDDFRILRFVYGAVKHWDASLDKGVTSNMEFHFKVLVIWSNQGTHTRVYYNCFKLVHSYITA